MATENSISTGWLVLYVVLALGLLYGVLAFVGAL
jgi:hypothetical protein